LELADRLWPGAEGWFADGEFHMACGGTLAGVLTGLAHSEISSTLSASQLKRLGKYMSVSEKKLTADAIEEKVRLKEMWRLERLHLSAPFGLWLDWWRDMHGERTDLKTWAAKQFVAEMAQAMLAVVKSARWAAVPDPCDLFKWVQTDSLPFNFDSDLSGQGSARDAGFSADTLGLKSAFRPLLELLAFIGLQRFRPAPVTGDQFRFCLWSVPLSPSVAAAAATGVLDSVGGPRFEFSLFSRTKYMKAFLPAQLQRGAR
jgi:CRISPR-associated protein Csb3